MEVQRMIAGEWNASTTQTPRKEASINLNNLVDKRLRMWTFGGAESSGFLQNEPI